MLKVGLTGGIGCGKSTAVQYFRELGASVIDADLIARNVVEPGKPALQDIVRDFGVQALLPDGSLDRAWLRRTVFHNPQRLQQLEAILHPRIKKEILQKMAKCQNSAYVIVDIPLLLEKGYKELFERVLVVDCLPEQQMQRVKLRDGSDESLIASIMQSQLGREQRLQQATDVLLNQSSIAEFHKHIKDLHKEFLMISGV
jgi:dephospho-CoA kinase